ncbi:MAG: DUF4406 domain-containing protein [Oscillospiraceae bacterium]|nr:DUF4406 domain-containing protein [Oscillospiraceae bacterium]
MTRPVVYIAGPITGWANYRERFAGVARDLEDLNYTPLNPAVLPEGMTPAQYMRICMAMLDSADAVVALPGWQESKGASIEVNLANYTATPVIMYPAHEVPVCRQLALGIALDAAIQNKKRRM